MEVHWVYEERDVRVEGGEARERELEWVRLTGYRGQSCLSQFGTRWHLHITRKGFHASIVRHCRKECLLSEVVI